MIHCPSCDTEVTRATQICPQCGTVLPFNTLLQDDTGSLEASSVAHGPLPGADATQRSLHPTATSSSTQPLVALQPPDPTPLFPQPLPAQQPLSRPMLVLLTTVAVLLMLSGFSLIYYTAVAHPAQLRMEATATVRAISTRDAHGTAIANVQATGTAQAIANGTATAQAQVTAQAQATTTALQAIYTQSTSGPPTFSASLAAQDSANWDTYETKDGGGCAFTSGALHASVFSMGYYVPCLAHATNFTNFAFQVQLTILRGDEGGLIFRSNDTNTKFYAFRIGRDGIYSLFVVKDSSHSLSLAYDNSTAIKTGAGQSNTLTIIARGSNFYLYINQQFVGTASDGSYGTGEIGIFASDTSSNTDVAFSNVKVWTLQ